MPSTEIRFRVLLFHEGDAWVSQSLDHDLNGQGSSIREAVTSVARVVATRAILDIKANIEPLSRTRPAPEKFRQMDRDSFTIAGEIVPYIEMDKVRAKAAEVKLLG